MPKYPTPPGDSMEPVARAFKDQRRQSRENARPDGTNIAQLVKKVREALVNINATVIAATNAYLSAATVAVTHLVASGNVSGANVTGGNVFAQSIATNITAGRVTVWGRTSDGFLGTASSSRRFKTNIRPSDIDPFAVLQVEDVLYQYIDEVRKRDDPTFAEYVGPDYRVATEIGAIAEQLHELGLWQFVIYEREPDGTLHRDDEGEPIPNGIHYQMLVMSIFPVLRMQQARLEDVETRLRDAGL